jgi:enoyl-CoA hydratase/carnithine racemase
LQDKDYQGSVELSVEDSPEGLVARLTIDNQAKLNILNSPLIEQLISAVAGLYGDERLRVLILTGAGNRAFIGGADVNEMAGFNPDSAREFISQLHDACAALRGLPVPVIARINGYCLGAGLEIAASCDLRVASEGSTFGMPEVKVGIPSVIEAALLPTLIGWGRSRELLLTGRQITADSALAWGLVERVVSADDLDSLAGDWVRAILEAGPRAVRLQKSLMREWEKLSLDQAIQRGIEAFSEAYATEEPKRLMDRFLMRSRHSKRDQHSEPDLPSKPDRP